MRTKKIMNLLCMAVLCAAATAVSSCSDDSPEQEVFKPKPDNWLAQLYPKMAGVCKPSGSVSGTQFFVLDYGIAVEDKDNPYDKSLFTPGTEKEYYVEYEGQKYFLGDTVPIPGCVLKTLRKGAESIFGSPISDHITSSRNGTTMHLWNTATRLCGPKRTSAPISRSTSSSIPTMWRTGKPRTTVSRMASVPSSCPPTGWASGLTASPLVTSSTTHTQSSADKAHR